MGSIVHGTWSGAMHVQGTDLTMIVHFGRGEAQEEATLDIPQQLAWGLKLADFTVNGDSVGFALLAPERVVFHGTIMRPETATADTAAAQTSQGKDPVPVISGTFAQGAAAGTKAGPASPSVTGTFDLHPAAAEAGETTDRAEVTIPAPGAASQQALLHGSLILRENSSHGSVPVVLIIAGSGPTDRDGNSILLPGKNDSLKMVAESLERSGIASLRIDKRGIGGSVWHGLTESEITFDDLVADAVAWIAFLKQDSRFSGVFVLGHSEGGLVATLAALKEQVSGEISVASLGKSYQDTLIGQLEILAPQLAEQAKSIVRELCAGNRVQEVPKDLVALFRPSVQPFLISVFKYDPAEALANVKAPALIVQGDRDLQVTPSDARLLDAARRQHANGYPTRLLIVHGMNHVLKQVPEDRESNQRAYSDPALPVSSDMMEAVTHFVQEQ